MEAERRATFWYCVALAEFAVILVLVVTFAFRFGASTNDFGTTEVRIVEVE